MVTVAVLGAGSRGLEYLSFVRFFHKKEATITAVCDHNAIRLKEVGDKFKIPENLRFPDAHTFFAAGKLADAVFVCTQDRDHYEHALAALDLGYHVLLEKPVSRHIDKCESLARKAREKGVHLVVCHVLRYANHYKKIKELLRGGELGDIVSITNCESVAHFHFAHSFVRGNWHNEAHSNPSLLAKCCHDIDFIQWFIDRECLSVSSFGSLTHFIKENAPAGAPVRCLDGCPVKKTCPYDAERLYIKDPFWKATFIKYMGRVLTDKIKSTRAEKYEALRHGDYGRCVYRCDNDVCDHQEVLMDFGNGVTAVHTMNAFTNKMYREIRITCTKGEIIGRDDKTKLTVNLFGKGNKKVRTRRVAAGGHVEGDMRFIAAFVRLLNGHTEGMEDITFIDATIPSHKIVMAAETSRLNGGNAVRVGETK